MYFIDDFKSLRDMIRSRTLLNNHHRKPGHLRKVGPSAETRPVTPYRHFLNQAIVEADLP